MQAQLRLSRVGARVVLPQRRLLATPPHLPPVPPPSGATSVRPVVVTATTLPPVPGSSTLPPVEPVRPIPTLPPPPPPPRQKNRLRRFLIYTTLGVLTFYTGSGYASTKSDAYRDLFVTIPGGEAVADYADDNHWEAFGPGTVYLAGQNAIARLTGQQAAPERPVSSAPPKGEVGRQVDRAIAESQKKADDVKAAARQSADKAKATAKDAEKKVSGEAQKISSDVKSAASDAKASAQSTLTSIKGKAVELKDKAVAATTGAADKAKSSVNKVEDKARAEAARVEASTKDAEVKAKAAAQQAGNEMRAAGSDAANKAREVEHDVSAKAREVEHDVSAKARRVGHDASSKVQQVSHDAASKTAELAHEAKDKIAAIPATFSEGVETMVREAENALKSGEDALLRAEKSIAPQPNGPRILPDTQRPRELRPETVIPEKPSFAGKEVYSEPLPLGFEPPPGFYVPPAPKAVAPVEPAPLPLLGPKVREFAASEPIIAQLASTIDSLTSSLSTANANKPNDASGILTKAQDDLSALSNRLDEVKKAERAKLEKTVGEKTKEFQAVLAQKEEERRKGEQGLQAGWNAERQKMVDEWRSSLDTELESQREGIEKRLREEVVSQGIELQRRWLMSIKTQVETERGGRLAKLDHLTTSLRQLEKITLDNSATLDDNVRVHKMWSAIRAINTKAEAGDVSFEEELRVLKTLASNKSDSIITPALNTIEASGAATTGIKSFPALSSWFSNSVAPRIHSASLLPAPEEATVLSHLASLGLSKIMFRPKPGMASGVAGPNGPGAGTDVGSVLARAEWCLSEKDLDGAAREVNALKGWPGKLASDWLREARRKLEVQQALEVVMTEATLDSLLLS